MQTIGQSVEGAVAANLAWQLAQQNNVSMPIVEQVYKVISNQTTPLEAVKSLLSRASREENIN